MLPIIWNFFSGYVIIKIEGLGLERLINRMIQNGVEIWNIRRQGTALTACISVKGFYRLPGLVRNTNCRVHIVGKRGALMTLSRFRFRKVLLYGWIVVLALLLALSRRVWFIRVEGCDQVKPAEITALLSEAGIKAGTSRSAVRTNQLSSLIRSADPRIAWAGAALQGVVLTLTIQEAEPIEFTEQGGEPSSIYAARDGVISEIHAYSGRAQVHAGDAVRAGDLLISGEIGNEEKKVYVAARGTITAVTPYVYEVYAGPTLQKAVRSGRSADGITLAFCGRTIWPFASPFELEETEITGEAPLGFLIPIAVSDCRSYELTLQQAKAGEEALLAAAEVRIQRMILEEVPNLARILSKSSEYTLLEDGSIYVKVTLLIEQDICEQRRLVADDGREDKPG